MEHSDDIDKLYSDWLAGMLSDEAFSQQVGKERFLKYKQIVAQLDSWTTGMEAHLADIDAIVSSKDSAKVIPLFARKTWLVAASISLLLIASAVVWFGMDSQTNYYVEAGTVEKITLPDNASVLYLSGGSSASLDKSAWKSGTRTISTSGKAYFDIAKGSTFTVLTTSGNVEVLGTRFEVDQFDKSLVVTCFEGKVKASKGSKEVILTAGQAWALQNDQWVEIAQPTDASPEWLQGKNSFNNAPLLQVIRTLEREYEISIDFSKINTKRVFTGTFPNDNLDLALKIVFDPLEIKYLKSENTLTLSE